MFLHSIQSHSQVSYWMDGLALVRRCRVVCNGATGHPRSFWRVLVHSFTHYLSHTLFLSSHSMRRTAVWAVNLLLQQHTRSYYTSTYLFIVQSSTIQCTVHVLREYVQIANLLLARCGQFDGGYLHLPKWLVRAWSHLPFWPLLFKSFHQLEELLTPMFRWSGFLDDQITLLLQ